MKIAMIQRFLPSQSRGGVAHFTHELANTLEARGHQVTVFSQDAAPADANYKVSCVGSSPSHKRSKLAPLIFPFQLAKVDFKEFDLIHAQGDDQFLSAKGVPIVRTLHGSSLIEAYYNGLARFSIKHFLLHLYFYFWEFIASMNARKVVAVSEDTRDFYPRVDAVIPNGINDTFFSADVVEKSRNPSILFVGEVLSRKRGDLLIDVFEREVLPKSPHAELWLIAPDKISKPHIQCFSDLTTAQVAEKFKQAWVLCQPSSYEGFGRPYAEALAAGLPVVASQNPGALEVLDHGKYGEIVQDASLGTTLLEILGSETRRRALSSEGQQRAARFAWGRVTEAYEKMYEQCLGNDTKND